MHASNNPLTLWRWLMLPIFKYTKVDVGALRRIAIDGFESNEVRRRVWPLLLGVDPNTELKEGQVGEHKYRDIVEKDVDRSLHHFDVSKKLRITKRDLLRAELTEMIDYVFTHNPQLHYIQGYHDICSVMLLVCGKRLGILLTERLSLLHIR